MEPIRFFVAGHAEPAGSKRAFFIKKLGRAVVTDANSKSGDWKKTVALFASHHYKGELLEGPLMVKFTFCVRRPDGHYGTGKNAGKLKASAPTYPAVKPDLLKLSRGVEDALTGQVWRDDALIVSEILAKVYATKPGVLIEIEAMPEKGRINGGPTNDRSTAETYRQKEAALWDQQAAGRQDQARPAGIQADSVAGLQS